MRSFYVSTPATVHMTPKAVLDIIDTARCREARSGAFLRHLQLRAQALPMCISFNSRAPASCLFQFSVEYIETAPRLIHAVDTCARDAGHEGLFTPFLDAAIRFFTNPSVLLSRYIGLDGLLISAYLCHRLMEDMYDNNHSFRRSQLVDLEATRANLLVHELIGEPFANELDDAVAITVRQIAGSPDYYDLNLDPFVAQANNAAWDSMRQYWENLLVRNHIRFTLGNRRRR
ncbi:hypothetical protein ATI45_2976 [Marinobacter sp. LV10MA510-1]|nr:hypothetical protein ATI45_2976 [Marinobacter sp. LV10MA510-1]